MNQLVKSFEPSRLNLSLCVLGGLAIVLASATLVILGETQIGIWLVLLGILAFLVEGHCMSLASAIKKQRELANGNQSTAQVQRCDGRS